MHSGEHPNAQMSLAVRQQVESVLAVLTQDGCAIMRDQQWVNLDALAASSQEGLQRVLKRLVTLYNRDQSSDPVVWRQRRRVLLELRHLSDRACHAWSPENVRLLAEIESAASAHDGVGGVNHQAAATDLHRQASWKSFTSSTLDDNNDADSDLLSSTESGRLRQQLLLSACYHQPKPNAQFYCQMCMEHVPAEDVHALIVCGHRFHVQCLRTFLEIEIREARIYPSCFQPDVDGGGDQPQRGPCGRAIPEHELAQLVSADTWTKYEQFKFCRDNPNARECPFCDHLQVCDIASSKEPECTCQQCHREFCFVHSNAHVGRSCADYDAQTADDQRLSRSTINQIAKPCPGCNNPVEKNGGCNHMTCVICRTSFCWLCCAIVDDSPAPEHFAWWNIAGCPNSLLADDHTAATDDDATPITTTNAVAACLLRLGAVLLVLVLGPIGAPLGLLCTACCWPSHRFRSRFRGNFRLALSWCIRMCMRLVWVLPLTIFVLIVTLPVVPFIGLAALSGEIESCFIDIRFELDWAIGRHGLRTCPQCTENITRPGGSARAFCQLCDHCVCCLCDSVVPPSASHFQWWHLDGCHEAHPTSHSGVRGQLLSVGRLLVLGSVAYPVALIATPVCWLLPSFRAFCDHSVLGGFNWFLRATIAVLGAAAESVCMLLFYIAISPYHGWRAISSHIR